MILDPHALLGTSMFDLPIFVRGMLYWQHIGIGFTAIVDQIVLPVPTTWKTETNHNKKTKTRTGQEKQEKQVQLCHPNRSWIDQLTEIGIYAVWSIIWRLVYGDFPYPFLNEFTLILLAAFFLAMVVLCLLLWLGSFVLRSRGVLPSFSVTSTASASKAD